LNINDVWIKVINEYEGKIERRKIFVYFSYRYLRSHPLAHKLHQILRDKDFQ
jgi:hypothetical protein